MKDLKHDLIEWYWNQNIFIKVILQILSRIPFIALGWIIGELIF